MNRAESVNIECDALLADHVAKVDWSQVYEHEAMSLKLAAGLYREVTHTYEKRRAAWGTATGGVMSMSVLALVCVLCGSSPWFALGIVIGSQAIRALWLSWKAHQASQDVRLFEQQTIEVINELAQAHPVGPNAQ